MVTVWQPMHHNGLQAVSILKNQVLSRYLYVCEFNCPTDFDPAEKIRDNDPYVANLVFS
jgi:hypothetical protein